MEVSGLSGRLNTPILMKSPDRMFALYFDLINAEAGSILSDEETIRFFDNENELRKFLGERKIQAEQIVAKERSIVLKNNYVGGVPYIFQYIIFCDPKGLVEEEIDEVVEQFCFGASVYDLAQVMETDQTIFEVS